MLSRTSSTPSKVTAPLEPVFIALYITVIIAGGFVCVYVPFLDAHSSTGIFDYTLLAVYFIFLCFLSRLPLLTVLSGNTLITYSLRGKHAIRTDKLTAVKRAVVFGSQNTTHPLRLSHSWWSIFALRCTDNRNRSVFINLRSVAASKRLLLYAPLNPDLHPHTQYDEKALKLLIYWLKPETFWSY
jgi:hypothetical protein